MEPYLISTERLGLRKWDERDLSSFAQMNSDKEVMRFFPKTLTVEETVQMMERINNHFDNHGFGLYAVEIRSTNEFIGYTGFMIPDFVSFFSPCVEIGWRIKKEEWNKGYATEAAIACLAYGFDKLKFDEVYSFTSILNLPSERIMQKIGMMKLSEFAHPKLPLDHPLSPHVLYRIQK